MPKPLLTIADSAGLLDNPALRIRFQSQREAVKMIRASIIQECSYRARSRKISADDAVLSLIDDGYAQLFDLAIKARAYLNSISDRSYKLLMAAIKRDIERMTL